MNVALRKMKREEYDDWIRVSIFSQAEINSCISGDSVEDEVKKLEQLLPRILPIGFDTKDNFFYSIDTNEEKNIGYIWIGAFPGLDELSIFLFDIHLMGSARSKGIGRNALIQLHSLVKSMGKKAIVLNVLKSNYAMKLYESIGYKIIENGEFSCKMILSELV